MARCSRALVTVCELACCLAALLITGAPPSAARAVPVPAISYGWNADRGAMPYIVALLTNKPTNTQTKLSRGDTANKYWYGCGGALIGGRVVVTAAHCMHDDEFNVTGVAIGLVNWITDRVDQYEHRLVVGQAVHERFNSTDDANDVALLVLDRAARSTRARLPPANLTLRGGDELWAAGWGRATEGGPAQSTLSYTAIPYLAQPRGNRVYTWVTGQPTDPSHIIAGWLQPWMSKFSDTCKGDSGGPLILPGRTPADDTLVGVTSYGPARQPCSGIYSIGTFSSMVALRPWIEQTVARLGLPPLT